jgi:predicted ATPase
LHRFSGNGLYLLDEPEAALSPQRQFTFLARLNDLVKAGAQFIIATHSPIILGYAPATIYEIDDKGYHQAEWDQLSHVQLTRTFLMNKDACLKKLFQAGQGELFE